MAASGDVRVSRVENEIQEQTYDYEDLADMDRLLDELAKGTALYKVKSASKLLQRTFSLDRKNMILHYDGTQKRFRSAKTDLRISQVREVREGEKDFSKKLNGLDKSLCFAVIVGANHKVIYLMAMRREMRDKWVRGLRYAIQMDKLAEQRNETDKWIRDAFNAADKNGDGSLDFNEILKLLKTINVDVKKKFAQDMFDAANTNRKDKKSNNTLDRQEFVNFYHQLTRRPELEELFVKFSRGKGVMNASDLLCFMREGQKRHDTDEEYCRHIIEIFEPQMAVKNREQLSLIGFTNFLKSEKQQLFKPKHGTVYQDMNQPFSHYYIDSSHNTYLTDDQLRGPSKVEAYISALERGCRCVELDCWDGSDDEPVIYHGYTLTSKILFRQVIEAVKLHAFKASPYPVILSLENHCSLQQQKVLASHLKTILGDLLWSPEGAYLKAMPSPEDLKHKIIIKGKRLPFPEAEVVSDEDESAENNNNIPSPAEDKKSKHKMVKEMSDITALQSVSFKGVDRAMAEDGAFVIFSLVEGKIEKLLQTQACEVNLLSHSKLLRIYPAGSRTDSSNYNPVPMWNAGCQVVALNYQTGSEPMQLNHGRFLDNGGTGYVLKPNFLLSGENTGSSSNKFPKATVHSMRPRNDPFQPGYNRDAMFGIVNGTVVNNNTKTLRITIVSGYQIPKPKDSDRGEIIDPFVKVEIHGVSSDYHEARTKAIDNNGLNPRWYESFNFTVRVPELAMVRFVVKDEDRGRDDFIGYYCLPFNSMQEGYRHFPIYNKYGSQYSQSMIFVHTTILSS
ncbi:1-phosphatidylinositol 4,5-bisphosphate phosphodiesterase delta-4 isoform X3 [Patella vulgata]|uniref:1-phosphatidylinositol 4,5-bisphosphate phosphodiesterase delta-4 isoform X3 n=1 Tax=Patella vulgata TaxID=6465 RepID=UPI00217F6E7C|nr:1-phosphatidylinositol 4,5-bisphosphate phosphodiesterase delta-4 isoform X3 [Patella vulgata]